MTQLLLSDQLRGRAYRAEGPARRRPLDARRSARGGLCRIQRRTGLRGRATRENENRLLGGVMLSEHRRLSRMIAELPNHES
jgi:hypothetical protein